jgi:HK97 family phage major capsid protein
MTKEQYLAKRQELLAKAEQELEAGDVQKSEASIKEVEALDTNFEAYAKARANMNALKDSKSVPSVAINMMEGDTVKTAHVENDAVKAMKDERGKKLKANNSVTIASSNIVVPTYESDTINPTFNQVSSLIDRVKIINLPGGESFKQPFLIGSADGDYKAEGAAYADADTTFGYATIAKSKVTAYSEDSEEVLKLPAADYDTEVIKGITTSLRRKITKEILIGAGGTNQFVGIFDDGATAIDSATDLGVSAITSTTLDEIIYAFGGTEDVEDTAVLILNKKDLKAFATLRTTTGEKVYTIVNNGNTGTIDGVPYIINSACKAVSDSGTTTGQYSMAYGPLSNYSMAIFSPVDVQRSTDFKFNVGMIAHKGSVFAGGNVTAKNGFLRVKKAAAV